MEPPACCCEPFNKHDGWEVPDRRVGKQQPFYAFYGSTHSTEFLLVQSQNARPRGRSGIARRASRLILGRGRLFQGCLHVVWSDGQRAVRPS